MVIKILNGFQNGREIMFNLIIDRIKRHRRYIKWRKLNPYNFTECINEFDLTSVSVGNYTYGPLTVLNFGGTNKLIIGSFCSIASGVVFNLAGDHPANLISTFPFRAKVLGYNYVEASSKGDIVIEDDVWIGQNAIILSGVTVAQGSVIAAGSVVTHDVPPYSIVGGVPAKVIKQRFNDDIKEYLLSLDYYSLSTKLIESHINDLYVPLYDLSLDEIKKLYEWFPKK